MKRAVVTGGTKGIGLSIAKMLLKEGYEVVITYAHDNEAVEKCKLELSAFSGSFSILKANQEDKEQMKALTAHIISLGSVDCLVCNAGMTIRKSLQNISDDEWEKTMQVNLNSYVYLIRDLWNVIKHDSRIVFIGSLMAIHPHAASLPYGVTKSAVHALALNLVKCFEGTGTTVNVVAPGFVETEWQKNKPQYIRNNICQKTALNRFASVDEIADAVRFCINNSFVNGSVIEVSGGYSYK